MRIFAQDHRKRWVLLPAVVLMLTASAAWAGDNPGPAVPSNPALPGVPSVPSAPGGPDTEHGPLRHTDLPAPAQPKAPSAPPTPPAPGIPYLQI